MKRQKALETMLFDSVATSHFNKVSDNLPIVEPSNKTVAMASSEMSKTSEQTQLPMAQLTDAVYKTDILQALNNYSLMSVNMLADQGYTTIFHSYDKGATVHANKDVTITFKDKVLLQ